MPTYGQFCPVAKTAETMANALDSGQIAMRGAPRLGARFSRWLGLHPTLGGIAPAGVPG